MEAQNFDSYYKELTDDQLAQVLADRTDLVPEAASALDREVKTRRLKTPAPPKWFRSPGSAGPVRSLNDYPEYQGLVERNRRRNRLWYFFAMGPLVVALIVARLISKPPDDFAFAGVIWGGCYAVYALYQNFRFLKFRCPQCGEVFGRGDVCNGCGFPRSAPTL